ncbi:MAG TPA: RidA family protein [Reyranella sp.]|nr:RidA family protein [Reyranella sp.]
MALNPLLHLLPPTVRRPFARYSHAVEVPAGARLVLVSGQLGIDADDSVPDSAEAQADLCFRAIAACLEEAGMGVADVVKLNAYVTDRAHMAGYMAARDRFITEPPPASTLMIVTGFTREAFKVEVEALAAKAD